MTLAMVPRRSEGPRGLNNLWFDPAETETAPSSGGELISRFRPASNHPDWKRWRAKAEEDSKAGRPSMGPYSYVEDRKQRGPERNSKAETESDSGQTEEEDTAASTPGKPHQGKPKSTKLTELGPAWRNTGKLHQRQPLYHSTELQQVPHASSTAKRPLLVSGHYATQNSAGELTGVWMDDLPEEIQGAVGLPDRPQPSPGAATVSPKSRQSTLLFTKTPRTPPASTGSSIKRQNRDQERQPKSRSKKRDKDSRDRDFAAAASQI